MSGEDDTFDIDIYGDDAPPTQGNENSIGHDDHPEDRIDFGDDDYDNNAQHSYDGAGDDPQYQSTSYTATPQEQQQSSQSGTKRKADEYESDNHPPQQASRGRTSLSCTPSQAPNSTSGGQVEHNATAALKLHDLHWWTNEEDLRDFASRAGVEDRLKDLAFGEHKINGKSRGEAYLEFASASAASATKKMIEEREAPKEGETDGRRKNVFQCWFCAVGNPFKGRDSGAVSKKDAAGAYNAAPVRGGFNRGGGFQGRGNFQGRGGGYGGRGGFQNQNQQNWNMNNGMGQQGSMGGGGYGNPMMGGMGRGGFGSMNPMMNNMGMMGNMMGNMMGGGFRGNMMGGGGNFQGRGGFPGGRGNFGAQGAGGFPQGGGMQQQGGFGGGGYGQGAQGGPPKRMKNE